MNLMSSLVRLFVTPRLDNSTMCIRVNDGYLFMSTTDLEAIHLMINSVNGIEFHFREGPSTGR